LLFRKKETNACPYCNALLENIPTRKSKCKSCGKYIFIRSGKLYTEEKAKEIDEERRERHENQHISSVLTQLKIGLSAYNKSLKNFPHDKYEVLKMAFDSTENKRSFSSSDYNLIAITLSQQGKDFFPYLVKSRRTELKKNKENADESGLKLIAEIMCGPDCCEICGQNDGKRMSIEEALNKMLIPNKHCSNIVYKGLCRCGYTYTAERDK